MSAEKLGNELKAILVKRIQSDQLVVPTIPTVAEKIHAALQEGEAGVAKRAPEILEQDAFLAARALRLAMGNKAAPGQKMTLSDAINKLGPRGVKALMVEATAQKVFVSRDAEIANALKRVWEHSVAVGTLARDVLALSGHADSDAAYLAGLLHDIGKPVVASLLLEAERQTTELYNRPWIGCAEWVTVVNQIHRAVGLALADKWQFPEAIRKCLQEGLDYDNADRNSLANAVLFANALAKKSGVYVGEVDLEDIDAVVMIGRSLIGANDEVLATLTKGLRDRVTGLFD
jgi:putative nucleotidyltransferase with HDIG domain